jgi:hypothetical protein
MILLTSSSVIAVRFAGVAGGIIGTLVGNALAWYPYTRYFLSTLEIPWERFWREIVWRTYPLAFALAGFLYIISRFWTPKNLWELALLGAVGMGLYEGLFFFGMDRAEKATLLGRVSIRLADRHANLEGWSICKLDFTNS